MGEGAWIQAVFTSCIGLVVLGPVACLGLGALAYRSRNYARAETMSTLAGVASWLLLGFEGLALVFALLEGANLFGLHPVVMAVIAYPPLLWFYARTLRRSVARRREEDRLGRKSLREEAKERKADEKHHARESEPPPVPPRAG